MPVEAITFSPIEPEAIPACAVDLFYKKSGQLTRQPRISIEQFDALQVTQDAIARTYLAVHDKTYSADDETERLVYLADINADDLLVGYGEVRFALNSEDDYFKNKPFVGHTRTEDKFQRNGLGLRRLRVMNAAAQLLFGLPLHSDTAISENAKRLWEDLIETGEAVDYIQRGDRLYNRRFHFVEEPTTS